MGVDGMGMLIDYFCVRCFLRSLMNSRELGFLVKGGICSDFLKRLLEGFD